MALIPIVDEDDNIIGHKERSQLEASDIYRATGLWMENSKGELLIAQRSFSKKHRPGKRGPAVSGTVEKGESYEENMLRETYEELGLRDFIYRYDRTVRRKKIDQNYFAQIFFAKIDKPISEFTLKTDEVTQIRWITKDKLSKEVQENPDNFLTIIKEYVGYAE